MQFLGFGIVFGFLLSRVGATDFNAIAEMFLLRDLHLAFLMGVAALFAGTILRILAKRTHAKEPAMITPKPRKPGNMVGGLMFGAGWALTGTCPGTGLAQLGEGKLMALFTVGGMFVGTALYRRYGEGLTALLPRLTHRDPTAQTAIAETKPAQIT